MCITEEEETAREDKSKTRSLPSPLNIRCTPQAMIPRSRAGTSKRRNLMQQSKTRTVSHDAGLDLGQQRILRWLERYPFQRAQDLLVALSPWEGRGAVYRRLADLEQRHLV